MKMKARILWIIGVLIPVLLMNQHAHAQFLKNLKGMVEQAQDESRQKTQEEKKTDIPANYSLNLTGSGSGLHFSYRMDMSGESMQGYRMDMDFELYIVPEKGGRTEVNMDIPVMGKMSMVTITHFANPNKIYLLNEKKKQYAVLDADDGEQEHFTITKLGEEILHGLKCMHGKATNGEGQVFEFWTIKDIPEYQQLLTVYSRSGRMGSYNLWQEMTATGTAGMVVKLLIPHPQGTATMELTQMKKVNLPARMIEIPSDYKESKGGWVKNYQNQM